MNAADIIKTLKLEPLPWEGGYFAETYRAAIDVPTTLLGDVYDGTTRQLSTAILYLLTPDTISRMHRVTGDEIFHFYLGDPVEQLHLHPDGSSRVIILGQDIARGHHVQVIVPGGVWQGARLVGGGSYALMGTTVSPGFSFDDFVLGDRRELQSQFPERSALIASLS